MGRNSGKKLTPCRIFTPIGIRASHDTIYLNHLISFVKNGCLKTITSRRLRELGKELRFYDGLPDLLPACRPLLSRVQNTKV